MRLRVRIRVIRRGVRIIGNLSGPGDLVIDVLFRLAEFLHGLPKALREFREFLRSEHDQYDEEYD